jgi:short-subunit dehydrogenase
MLTMMSLTCALHHPQTMARLLVVFIVFAISAQVSCIAEWGAPRIYKQGDEESRRRRRLVVARVGSYESNGALASTTDDGNWWRAVQMATRTRPVLKESVDLETEEDALFKDEILVSSNSRRLSGHGHPISAVQLTNRVKAWPPWPLSLLTSEKELSSPDQDTATTYEYPSAGALFWSYFKQRARVGVRQIQEVGSQLWFNLPPAAPPLILLASIPRTIIQENKEVGDAISRRVIPILSNGFARNLALTWLGLAVMSWAHTEVHRKRKLTPLQLNVSSRSVSQVFLPPYLPEEVPEPEIEALQLVEESRQETNQEQEESNGPESYLRSIVNPKLRKHLNHLSELPNPQTFRSTIREWGRVRDARKREAAKVRRLLIFDELIALQALKRLRSQKKFRQDGIVDAKPGYALVTGASQGIGRSIAVELARWGIPVILVARDIDRLISLAYDLEACYGVRCCVLKADLSQVDAAEKIHKITHDADLNVDILVNNAGFSLDGMLVDMGVLDVERMVMLNAMTYAKLSALYGKDMKEQRRGRILMVSSMSGLCSASPNSGLYGATKAFEKSLAFSMANELESHGVGVTCLIPGAVKNTQFRSRSNSGRALCWYLPFYARPAQYVAHQGVMSMLDGDTEVIPGWQNRIFAKLLRPILPQRAEIMAVKTAWSPFEFPLPSFMRRRKAEDNGKWKEGTNQKGVQEVPGEHPTPNLMPRYNNQLPPRLLQLPVPEPKPPKIVDPEPSVTDSSAEDAVSTDDDSGKMALDQTNQDTFGKVDLPVGDGPLAS